MGEHKNWSKGPIQTVCWKKRHLSENVMWNIVTDIAGVKNIAICLVQISFSPTLDSNWQPFKQPKLHPPASPPSEECEGSYTREEQYMLKQGEMTQTPKHSFITGDTPDPKVSSTGFVPSTSQIPLSLHGNKSHNRPHPAGSTYAKPYTWAHTRYQSGHQES